MSAASVRSFLNMEHKPDQMPSVDAMMNEQSVYFDAHPEHIQPEYLNNFYLVISSSGLRDQVLQYAPTAADEILRDNEKNPLNSKLRIAQTFGQFWEAIDTEAANILDTQEIQKLFETLHAAQKEMRASRAEKRTDDWMRALEQVQTATTQLHTLLVPLYLALRIKGYSHYDLVA